MGDFSNPFGGFNFGDLFGVLSGLLGDLIAAIQYVFNVLVAIAQYLFNLLVAIAQALVQFLVAAEKLMVHVFENLYTKIIQPIIDEINKIEAWIKRTLDPVIKFVQRVRAWYEKYILPYQKLTLQIISIVRKFLAVFELFGAKWAKKLDQDLQKVQSYVTASILDVLQALNGITSWLQLVTDPTQILRKQFWANTAFTGLHEIYTAANLGALKPVSAAETQQGQQNLGLLNPATPPVKSAGGTDVTLSPAFADVKAKLLAALPDYNPTVSGYTGPVQA